MIDLTSLGFTKGENNAYIALLELGPSTVGPIVKRSGIAYANIYDVLNRLTKKGMVTFVTKGNTKTFQASSPLQLNYILKKKEEELQEKKEFAKDVIPELEKLQDQHESENAEIFIGFNGLKTAYKKLLSSVEEELVATYIEDEYYKEASDAFYSELSLEYGVKKIRIVANEEFKKSNYAKVIKHPMRYTDIPIFSHVEVAGSKLLFVSWQKPIMATLITAKNLADNYRNYFENIWKLAKK